MGNLTTHVSNTDGCRPAAGIRVELYHICKHVTFTGAAGTNADGGWGIAGPDPHCRGRTPLSPDGCFSDGES